VQPTRQHTTRAEGHPLNYFAHALRFLDADPHFIAGTAVPDWMSVADRPVRVRAKLAEALLTMPLEPAMEHVARGALQHLHDDGWFHATPAFHEVTTALALRFRQALGPEHPLPCGFLGHIVCELLLDAALIERHPDELARYYEQLTRVDAVLIEDTVNRMARGRTERLKLLIPLFQADQFLYDYTDDARLLARLNRVLRRVRLDEQLPTDALAVIAHARVLVRERCDDLLPSEHFQLD
jgi:hypothetical protein